MWISSITVVIVEGGVRLKLNIVDTPGYGDQVNNEGCWEPIVRYVRPTRHNSLSGPKRS
jgi:septin family protein